jgi:hypothetical protein
MDDLRGKDGAGWWEHLPSGPDAERVPLWPRRPDADPTAEPRPDPGIPTLEWAMPKVPAEPPPPPRRRRADRAPLLVGLLVAVGLVVAVVAIVQRGAAKHPGSPPVTVPAPATPVGAGTPSAGDPAASSVAPSSGKPSPSGPVSRPATPKPNPRRSMSAVPIPGPSPPLPMTAASYEAEAAVLASGARVDGLDGASGDTAVYAIGAPNRGTVRFTGVSAPAARSYRMTIYYHNPSSSNRTATVSVNGAAPVTLSFRPTGDCCVSTVTMTVALDAGAGNTVLVGNPQSRAPDLDRIVLSELPA